MTSQGPGILNGYLPEAQFLTLELKFEALDTWPKDTRIVFYSNAGHRSLEVSSYFMAYCFTNVPQHGRRPRSLVRGVAGLETLETYHYSPWKCQR